MEISERLYHSTIVSSFTVLGAGLLNGLGDRKLLNPMVGEHIGDFSLPFIATVCSSALGIVLETNGHRWGKFVPHLAMTAVAGLAIGAETGLIHFGTPDLLDLPVAGLGLVTGAIMVEYTRLQRD